MKAAAKLSLYKISQQFAGQSNTLSTLVAPQRSSNQQLGRTQVDWKRKLSQLPFITPANERQPVAALLEEEPLARARARVRDLSIGPRESSWRRPAGSLPYVPGMLHSIQLGRSRASIFFILPPEAARPLGDGRAPDGARLLTCPYLAQVRRARRCRRRSAGRRGRRRGSTGARVA